MANTLQAGTNQTDLFTLGLSDKTFEGSKPLFRTKVFTRKLVTRLA